MGDALLHSIEAKGYGRGVTDGDRNGGGGEEHRRASGRPTEASKKLIKGWASFTGSR
jgi:hypothetical protein